MTFAARVSGVAALAVALLAAVLVSASGASAHARYVSSTPADGATVAESPAQIEAVFAEEMGRSGGLPTMVLVNESGDVIADGPVLNDADRTKMTLDLPPSLPEGRYTVIWHNISDDDGDEAQGAFVFFVGGGSSQTPGPSDTAAATAAPTTVITNPGTSDDGSNDIPLWALIAGVAVGLCAGASAGVVLGSRRDT
ncbi:MAG: copper resistance protein CopC [Dehalococcoidia bacterium]